MKMWCVVWFAALASAVSGQVAFEDVEVLTVESGVVVDLFAGDVDGDGHPDLVVETSGSDGFLVARSLGADGFLEPVPQIDVVPGLESALGDVDGDGAVELIVLENPREIVTYRFIDDAYEVDQRVQLPADSAVLTVGRLDRDPFDDVLVVNAPSGRIHLAFGSNSGLVVAPAIFGVVDARDLALGDVDDNGFTDVLVADGSAGSQGAELIVLFQRPDGGYDRVEVDVATGFPNLASSVASGDLDGDGVDDAVVVVGATVRVIFGAPGAALGGEVLVAASSALFVEVIDFDGDGDAEVFVDGGTNNSRIVDVVGDGFEVLASPSSRTVAADFDEDGMTDGVFASTRSVDILAGTGDLAWRQYLASPVATATSPFVPYSSRLTVIDIDDDGIEDVVLGVQYGGIYAALGGAPATVPERLEGVPGDRVAAARDIDGDGLVDLVTIDVAEDLTTTVVTSLGDGGGRFTPGVASEVAIPAAAPLADGDFTGDGVVDLIVGGVQRVVLEGDGAGRFAAAYSFDVGDGFIGTTIAADVDGDGQLDLFDSKKGPGPDTLELRLFEGGRLGPPVEVTEYPEFFGSYDVADVNGDGFADVASIVDPTVLGSSRVAIREGRGDGTFADPVEVQLPVSARQLALADVDGDGRTDLVGLTTVFGTATKLRVGILFQTSAGAFDASTVADVAGSDGDEFPDRAPFVVDFDGDGLLDVLVPREPNDLAILRPAIPTWTSLGESLAGPDGFSSLAAEGSLEPGSDVTITVPNGPPDVVVTLVVGLSAANAPFLGGVLVPQTDVTLRSVTDADGHVTFTFPWRDPPPGAEVFVQAWFPTVPASTIALRGAPPD